jgi:hypothetical protein
MLGFCCQSRFRFECRQPLLNFTPRQFPFEHFRSSTSVNNSVRLTSSLIRAIKMAFVYSNHPCFPGARGQNLTFALASPTSFAYHEPMLNVTLNDKTAKLLESYRRSKRLSREKALEVLLEDVMQRIVPDISHSSCPQRRRSSVTRFQNQPVRIKQCCDHLRK